MEALNIKEIVSATGGTLVNCSEDMIVNGISTDSRDINAGDLFVALKGKNFNGHDFIPKALESGCTAVLASEEIEDNIPLIKVDDTLEALKLLAKYYRSKFSYPVIAVTGSTGKTSTKEMISSILSQKFKVHKTRKNYNNEIGLPLTIFDMSNKYDVSVIELGMSNLGEIKRLVDIARPDIAVITNIGTAHIENLKTRKNIFKAKMEITTYFNSDNLLIVNGDDDYLSAVSNKNYNIIKTSISNKGNYNAEDIINLGSKGIEFTSKYKGNKYKFKINAPGIHNVYNALMGIAVADKFNLSLEQLIDGIYNYKPSNMRNDIIELPDGIRIINDCYNANLDSMKAAIDVLNSISNGRRIAILGDMYELGDFSIKAHKDVGIYLKDKCDILISVGQDAKYIYDEAVNNMKAYYFRTKEEACQLIKKIITNNDTILVKASRAMQMESVVDFIVKDRKRGI